jgi:hypothetical protein
MQEIAPVAQILDDPPVQGKTYSAQPRKKKSWYAPTLVGTSLWRGGHEARDYKGEKGTRLSSIDGGEAQ